MSDLETSAQPFQIIGGAAPHECGHRYRVRAVPVFVERRLDVLDRRAHQRHVAVGERRVGVGFEESVVDVAPAENRHLVVNGVRLGVHAMVERTRASHVLHCPGPAPLPRVEETYLDGRVGVQRNPDVFSLVAVQVVDQHSHANPTVGGLEQLADQQTPYGVLAEDVVLQVDAALGPVGEDRPGHERIPSAAEQEQPILSRVPGHALGQVSAETGPESFFQWDRLTCHTIVGVRKAHLVNGSKAALLASDEQGPRTGR
ncbi:MAG TPA: hypothetical protein VLG28_12960 [Acidimicrobiia bacterium]|jgi:hypothetical protein|nr:hypothetical protein [Acidimicrobiia bacterium]